MGSFVETKTEKREAKRTYTPRTPKLNGEIIGIIKWLIGQADSRWSKGKKNLYWKNKDESPSENQIKIKEWIAKQ